MPTYAAPGSIHPDVELMRTGAMVATPTAFGPTHPVKGTYKLSPDLRPAICTARHEERIADKGRGKLSRLARKSLYAILPAILLAACPLRAQQPNTNPRSLSFYNHDRSMVRCSVSNGTENDVSIGKYFLRTKNAPSIKLSYSGESKQAPTEITVTPLAGEPGVTRLLTCEGLVSTADAVVEAGKPYTVRFDEGGSKRIIATHTTPDGRTNYDVLSINVQDPRQMEQTINELADTVLPNVCLAGRVELASYLNAYKDNLYELLSAGSFEELPFRLPALSDMLDARDAETLGKNSKDTVKNALNGGHNPRLDYRIEGDTIVSVSDTRYSRITMRPGTLVIDNSNITDPEGHAIKYFSVLLKDGKTIPEETEIGYTDRIEYQDLESGRYTLLKGAVCDQNKASIAKHSILVTEE